MLQKSFRQKKNTSFRQYKVAKMLKRMFGKKHYTYFYK